MTKGQRPGLEKITMSYLNSSQLKQAIGEFSTKNEFRKGCQEKGKCGGHE